MSLSKQLYSIIAIIFFMIFVGNFIISTNNTKAYLEEESQIKAQDTATLLGMTLKNLIINKNDPQIESIIKAIANSGFYKQIKLEDAYFTITEDQLKSGARNLDDSVWTIQSAKVDKKYGKLELIQSDADISKELSELEDEKPSQIQVDTTKSYNYIPSKKYENGGDIRFDFSVKNSNNQIVNTYANIDINKVIFDTKRNIKFADVPNWFINLIPIKLDEKYSEISDGWKTTAIIKVSANPGQAYSKLYNQAKISLLYSAIAFLIAMLLIYLFVKFLLKPLKNLEILANDISIGKFNIIKKLPWTTELRSVSLAFNDMSGKIEAIIDKLNTNLEMITKKLSLDEITSLPLMQTFETDMKSMFIGKKHGYVLIIKLYDLSSFAKSHTNRETNNFIKKFSKILKDEDTKRGQRVTAYRFFGSEFALICNNFNKTEIQEFAKLLKKDFTDLGKEYKRIDIAHIGATPFNSFCSTPSVLEKAQEAYEKARLIGSNEVSINDSSNLSRDNETWREIVYNVVDEANFNIDYIQDTYLLNSSKLIMQEAFANVKDNDNNEIAIGAFISIAQKYDKAVDFDKRVVKKVVSHILTKNINHDITINLSLDSISNVSFLKWIEDVIIENKSIANQLVFSVTSYAVAQNTDKFKIFTDMVHKNNAKIIIKRFETKFIPLESIKNFNLDYIRLAKDYTKHINTDISKQNFVESMQELSNLLNIKVIAESVQDDEDFETLTKYKLYGASR